VHPILKNRESEEEYDNLAQELKLCHVVFSAFTFGCLWDNLGSSETIRKSIDPKQRMSVCLTVCSPLHRLELPKLTEVIHFHWKLAFPII